MINKVEGYALVNADGKFLHCEQVWHDRVEVYAYHSPSPTLWDTEEDAIKQADYMINGGGNFKFDIHEEDYPVSVIKVTKLIHYEESERLFPYV